MPWMNRIARGQRYLSPLLQAFKLQPTGHGTRSGRCVPGIVNGLPVWGTASQEADRDPSRAGMRIFPLPIEPATNTVHVNYRFYK